MTSRAFPQGALASASRAVFAGLLGSAPLSAQQPLLGAGGIGIAPTAHAVQFPNGVVQDSLRIRAVQQAVAPIVLRAPLRGDWNLEIVGGYTFARLETGRASASQVRMLQGPLDTRVRLFGPLLRDVVSFSLAVNAPTGLVELNANEFAILRTIAAPALAMPAPVLGSGLGVTTGLVAARRIQQWAVALGGSYEVRTRFTPVEAAIVGAVSNASLTPAAVSRTSVALTRAFGRQEVTMIGGLDLYGSDLVQAVVANRPETVRYRLGATRSATASWRITNTFVRSAGLTASVRSRAPFTDSRGKQAEGSGGSFADFVGSISTGNPRRFGIELAMDARLQSGLRIDPSLATAAANVVGSALTMRLPAGSAFWRITLRGEQGTLDTGRERAPFRAASMTLSLGPAR